MASLLEEFFIEFLCLKIVRIKKIVCFSPHTFFLKVVYLQINFKLAINFEILMVSRYEIPTCEDMVAVDWELELIKQ